MTFGFNELIIPAVIVVGIIVFYKIFRNKSTEVAKNLGKEIEEVKKMTRELPRSFREGIEEVKKESKYDKVEEA
jgi:Sec-independent protein translocase protein TatA